MCLAAAAQLGRESLLPKSICYVSVRDVFSPRKRKGVTRFFPDLIPLKSVAFPVCKEKSAWWGSVLGLARFLGLSGFPRILGLRGRRKNNNEIGN